MTIRNAAAFYESPAAGFDGVFDWDFLLPAFEGTKIQPMDFDCVIERKGRFLVFETKRPGQDLPEGQRISLESAVETGLFHVIYINAKRPIDITGFEVWFLGKSRTVEKQQRIGTHEDVVSVTRKWFEWANRKGCVK